LTNTSQSKEEYQEDALRRINQWLNVLEERITELLSDNDPKSMKPGEREQAADRHFTLILQLLKLRQEYAESDDSELRILRRLVIFGEDEGRTEPTQHLQQSH
jgi:hypothetical protein